MRTITAVVLILSVGVLVCDCIIAATYEKVSDTKIGVTTQVSRELTIAEIKHEIEGINRDIERIEASKQAFIDRRATYEDMLENAELLGVTEPVKPVTEPIIEPIAEPEHTI